MNVSQNVSKEHSKDSFCGFVFENRLQSNIQKNNGYTLRIDSPSKHFVPCII